MARRDEYAPDLDDLIGPSEPKGPQPDYMREFEAEMRRIKADEAKKEEARQAKSREFRISPNAVKGGDPGEDY